MAKLRPAIFIISIIVAFSTAYPVIMPHGAKADDDPVRWNRVNIPAEGYAGNWTLADNSDIQHLTISGDGTLYAYGRGLGYTLYKSTDDGYNWSYVGNVQDEIVDIAVAPDDSSRIYYATTATIHRSTDGGETFVTLKANPGGAGSDNLEITCLDVARHNDYIITVGTRDTDSSQFGGVYTLDESEIIPVWTDTGIGSYDVYAVAFSPNYAADRQISAVATDETDTLVITKAGDNAWGADISNAVLDRDNSGTPVPVATTESAAIGFPENYDGDAYSANCIRYVALDSNSGNGDVYEIKGAAATDLNVGSSYGAANIDITGLAISGDAEAACLLAGAADSTQVYFSSDGGESWTKSRKEPTGSSLTHVLFHRDYNDSQVIYSATTGGESAVSLSRDNGATWNQIGLIDTTMSNIVDLAPSPAYEQDNTIFMISFGGSSSLWRSRDAGAGWERIYCSALANVDSFNLVGLPPQYDVKNQSVFLAGESNGHTAIWKSRDDGQRFTRYLAMDPDTGDAVSIDVWTLADDNTLFIGSYDGSNGLIYATEDSGFTFCRKASAGSQPLRSLTLSPDYANDKTILAGNDNGAVYLSEDNGKSFRALPADAASSPLTGSITVAFDNNYADNNTVYAASDTADRGIYRYKNADWVSIDSSLPDDATISQLAVADNGALYAANSDNDGGMERCLDPKNPLATSFETVTRGLSDSVSLTGLWICGDRLWSIDNTNTRLMTFTDSLMTPVAHTSPADDLTGIGTLSNHSIGNINLDWEPLDEATSYQWQLNYNPDFSSIPDGFEGTTGASYAHLPTLEPGTRYYWRVRATAPVLSPWSAKWSFTTAMDTAISALQLASPSAGAVGISVKPLFRWQPVGGADTYELLVAPDMSMATPLITKTEDYALPTTTWQCNISLEYDTVYYWKVRAVSGDTCSAWSAVASFTTEAMPQVPLQEATVTLNPTVTLPPALTPNPTITMSPTPAPTTIYQVLPATTAIAPPPDTPDWVLYLIGALLLNGLILMIIVMMLITRIRRT